MFFRILSGTAKPSGHVRTAWEDVMNSGISTLRRNVLIAASASLATSLLEGAVAEAQTQAPDVGSSIGPAISEFNGKLYAMWKDATDAGLWYASFDGSKWSAAARIPNVASSSGPSLAAFGNKLYAAWKGQNTDQRLWYASFDGLKWSPQAQIPGATSSGGPALSVFNGKLYAVWKGSGADVGLACSSFDGSTWSNMPNVPSPVNVSNPPNTHPFSPQTIANSGLSGAGGVDQGKYNDCVFEAAAAAVATTARGQLAISQAIVQNSDGSFTVTFPGAPQRPIKATQTDLKTTGVHDSATWADVLEAALIISDPNFANGSHPPPDAKGAADGSRPTPAQYALHLLTGSPASKDVASSPRIGNKIAQALGNGQPVVAFCANNDEGALVSGHEWTVMACDPQANRITLRNPWGNFKTAGTSKAGVTYDGNAEVTMTLQLFGQFYKEITLGYYRV
jgi:hypothetical protein